MTPFPITLVRLPVGALRGPTHGLRAPYSERFVEAMHEVPGLVWNKRRRLTEGYLDAIILGLEALKRRGFAVDALLASVKKEADRPPGMILLNVAYSGLREYQKPGVDYAIRNAITGALIADEMGLGKSAEAVRAARAFKRPTLIICPSIARGVWGSPGDNQVEKWWPDAGEPRVLEGVLDMPFKLRTEKGKYIVLPKGGERATFPGTGMAFAPPGSVITWREAKRWIAHNNKRGIRLTPEPVPLPPAMVTVVHYEILHAWAPHLIGTFHTLIIDEIHNWVGTYRETDDGPRGAKRSGAGRALAERAGAVIALTGTPMTNLTASIYNALDTLCPGRFGSYYDFTRRYCGGHMEQVTPERKAWVARQVTNADELAWRLKFFMIRRTKAEVASELPARTRIISEIDLPAKFSIKPGATFKTSKAVRKALEVASEGKIPIVVDLAKDYAKSAKGVVYTRFRRTAEEIAAGLSLAGVDHVHFIHGGVTYKTRARRIEERPTVLVSTMDVLAGAISLTYATWGLFAELHHNPQVMVQCEGRHHRIGQENPVTYYYPVARKTLDELLRDRVLTKLAAAEQVVGVSDHNLATDLAVEPDEVVLFKMFERLSEGQGGDETDDGAD